jgi:sulfur-oxidizing protein SoxZ
MPEPTRIRAQINGDRTIVRILAAHQMESGQRKGADGKPLPAWFIQTLSVRHNDQIVLRTQCGPAVARNPFFQFSFKGGAPGDRVIVSWADNHGETRTDETKVR